MPETAWSDTSIDIHLRFKKAQPKMFHCPKVEDGVENQFFTSWTHFLGIKKKTL